MEILENLSWLIRFDFLFDFFYFNHFSFIRGKRFEVQMEIRGGK